MIELQLELRDNTLHITTPDKSYIVDQFGFAYRVECGETIPIVELALELREIAGKANDSDN